MPEFARRCYPATLRLKELLATSLGSPRLVLGHSRLFGFDRYAVPGPTTQISPAPLLIDPGSFLIDWCSFLMQALPSRCTGRGAWSSLRGRRNDEPDFESFVATFPGGARPRSVLAATTGQLGRGEPLPAGVGVPGLRRAWRGLARDARANPVVGTRAALMKRDCRWSPPSAMCSMTSSIASSTRGNRWLPRSTTPWKSHAWCRTSDETRIRVPASVKRPRPREETGDG